MGLPFHEDCRSGTILTFSCFPDNNGSPSLWQKGEREGATNTLEIHLNGWQNEGEPHF